MKQFLRSFLTLLMLVVWASGFAQEVTLDFTNAASDWKIPTVEQQKSAQFTNGTYTISLTPVGGNYKVINSGVILGKKGATLTLPAFDFDVEKIIVRKNTGSVSGKVTQNIFVGTQAVSTQTKGASQDQTYKIDAKYQAAGNIYVLKVTNGNNTQFSKIEIYKKTSSKTPTTLIFPEQTISINGGDEASFKGQSAKLYAGEQELTDKTIKYDHTGNDIFATFDVTTGAATLKSGVYGTAKVTATYAGDDTYEKAVASYTVKIVDPNAIETTFDFKKPENYGYGTSSSNSHEGDLDDNGGQIISNGVVITSTSNSGTPNRFWNDGLRVYDNSTFVISASGYKIVEVTTEGAQYTWTYNNDGTAVCDVTKATLTSMTVTMSPLSNVTFTENENNDDALKKHDKETVNTTLTRTLVANKWNTFCVPFETEIAGTALEGATVKSIGTVVGNVINLEDAAKIEAGVPYLVMPTTESIVNPTFKNVTISVTTPIEKGNDEYKFVGTYSPKPITDGDFGKIWGVTAEGKLAKINANTTMKGLRAYFVFPTSAAAAKLNFDGETTGINNIETNAAVNSKVYNLNGQYVGNSLNGLKKGIYVVNGKKVIK